MPLANLLAPMILRRARDIEDQIGPPAYLRAQGITPEPPQGMQGHGVMQVGYEKTPYDPKGLMDKPEAKPFDSTNPGNMGATIIGRLQQGGPLGQAAARGYLEGLKVNRIAPLPNAQMPSAQMPAPVPAAPGKMILKAGVPVGYNERGEVIDVKGKSFGYLNNPSLSTGKGDVPVRTGEMKDQDYAIDRTLKTPTPDAVAAMRRAYGPHLKAMEENRDANGYATDQFPQGYFNTPELKKKRKNIEEGTRALQAVEREFDPTRAKGIAI